MDFSIGRIQISYQKQMDVFISASMPDFEVDAYQGCQPEIKKKVYKNYIKFTHNYIVMIAV
jgi:ABC-type molybdate transport system substrate-binding protein